MIHLVNESKHAVVVTVNEGDDITILAQQALDLPVVAPQARISLRHTYPSYTKADTAHFSVGITYTVDASRDITLRIYREKIRFDLNGYYDALLLRDDDAVLTREYRVSNVAKVRKKLRNYKILYSLFVDPLEDILLDPIVEFGCLGSLLYYGLIIFVGTYFRVWKYILLALVAVLLLDGLLSLLLDISVKHLFGKMGAKQTTALSELDRWTQPETLAEFYSHPDWEGFGKEVYH
jgi:hypothetical protein